MKRDLHIVFTYPESYPQEFIEQEIADFDGGNLKFQVERQGNAMYASMEWMVPTFFATYILKPYFESFLKEAGKDHYEMLKTACKKMLHKGKITQAQLISSTESTKKLSGNYNQSIVVSIIFQTKSNRIIKMLFDSNLNLTDWEIAVDDFFKIILEHYDNYPEDNLSFEIKDLSEKPYYTLYIKINPVTKKLEFHDDHTLIQETRNLNRS